MLNTINKQYPPLTIRDISKLTNISVSTLYVYINSKHFTDIRTYREHKVKYYSGITDRHLTRLKTMYLKRTDKEHSYIFGGWQNKWKKQYNGLTNINR